MVRILRDFGVVFDDVFVTTCNLEAMNPNINTEEGLAFIMAALGAFIFKVKLGWPRNQLLLVIIFLLKCNVFQFDETHFRQIEGCHRESFYLHVGCGAFLPDRVFNIGN